MRALATSLVERKRALLAILALVVVSPLFGIVGAELVGYHEPLDLAAEILGREEVEGLWWSPFPDYTVPGLAEDWLSLSLGYVISGVIGVCVILAVGMALSGLAKR